MKNKKILVTLSLFFITVALFVGCGKNEENNTPSTSEVTTENEISENSSENTVPDDNFVISWQDEVLAKIVRQVTGIEEGNICYAHVKDVRGIELKDNWVKVYSTSALKYMPNLEYINMWDFGGEEAELIGLKHLTEIMAPAEKIRFIDMEGQTIEVGNDTVYIDSNNFLYQDD